MSKKCIVLCLAVFLLICIGIAAWAGEKSLNRVVSERLIVQIDFSSWIQESLKVSPDSKHVAYGTREGDKQFVVVDGEEGKRYEGIGEGTLIFSPDSERLAYGAQEGNKRFVVVDGKEEKRYDGIGTTLIFSPDSERLAYTAAEGDKWFVVVDEEEGKRYEYIEGDSLIFSPDSERLAYAAAYTAAEGDKEFVVLDGEEGKRYEGIVTISGGKIIFDSLDSLHYLALKGSNSIYLMEERVK